MSGKKSDPTFNLTLPANQVNKLRYFLNRFKGQEWSGPAWYKEEFDKNGFPTNVVLKHWHPLHLGTGAHTEWDGKDLIKQMGRLRKEYPEIGKDWVQGNIHSHHNMGAFFSDTDDKQLIDGAFNDMFYYSLVVSIKAGQELAFAVSWIDQYNRVHIEECDEIGKDVVHTVDAAWKSEGNAIQKKEKKAKKSKWASTYNNNVYYPGGGYAGQSTLWEKEEDKKKPKTRPGKTKRLPSYQPPFTNGGR